MTLLSGGRDKQIRVWSASGRLIRSLEGHRNSVLCIEKMAEDLFLSCSRDRQILVWKDFTIAGTILAHTATVLSLCRLTGTTFASSSADGTICISDLQGRRLRVLDEHGGWVWSVDRLEEDVLASCSEDGTVRIWRGDAASSIRTFYEGEPVVSLAYNAPARQLISGSLSGRLSIRTLGDGYGQQAMHSFPAHAGAIRTIRILGNQLIATGGEDSRVKLWTAGGRLVSALEHRNFVQAVVQLDAQTILSASYDGTIKAWPVPPLI